MPVRVQASAGPIGDVTGLRVTCGSHALAFRWTPPPDTAGFLANYRVLFDGGSLPIKLPSEATTFTETGLSPASKHTFSIQTVDAFGSLSTGVVLTAATLLNPPQLVALPGNNQATLSWSDVQPNELLSQYAVYVEPFAFSSTEGLAPWLATNADQVTVTGLVNGQAYYCAVTAINISGGESTLSNVARVTPTNQPGAQVQMIVNPLATHLNIGDEFTYQVALTNSGAVTLSGVPNDQPDTRGIGTPKR